MTAADVVRERAERVRSHEAERAELADAIRQARSEGAKIAELMAWTGYSRRRIFQLLQEAKSV